MTTAVLLAPSEPTTGALLPIYKRQPVEFVRGSGVELFDALGRPYLDFTSGIAVNALGHSDEGVLAAAHAALDCGPIHVSNLYHSAPARDLASALVERSFAASVFLCNSGAEANEGAFKFARRWARETYGTAKTEIIALRGSFHGRLFATLAATDRPAYRAPFRPLAGGISITERDLGKLEAAMGENTVAAVIVEPVQGEGGVRVLSASFLRGVRDLTRQYDVALIFDEIQCGLGRTGSLFAYQRLGIEPDILTLAKPLAGGLPMGAVLMAEPIARAIKAGDHATTFGGGPFVSSVALHVLQRIADPELLNNVRANGEWLGDKLESLASSSPRVREVRGVGYMWGIDIVEPAASIVEQALTEGLLLCTAGEHTVRILPPLIATRADLSRGLAILEGLLQ